MPAKRLPKEKLQQIKDMLERGFKVSVIAEAVECSDKMVYLIRSGKYEEHLKNWREANIAKKVEQSNLLCSNSKCFAFIDGCGSGRCSILNSIDFGNRKCPFFKTRERMDFEERKTNLRLEELGMGGVAYE